MKNSITTATPLFLDVEDVMLILGNKESWSYDHMRTIRGLYPDRCKNGKKIPTNVLAEYHNLDIDDIGRVLSKTKLIP